MTIEEVKDEINQPFLRIEQPRPINGIFCTLVVMKNIERAEFLCKELNNKRIKTEVIKAHIHPDSKVINRSERSYNRIFNSQSTPKPVSKTKAKAPPVPIDYLKAVSSLLEQSKKDLSVNPFANLIKERTPRQEPKTEVKDTRESNVDMEEGEIHEQMSNSYNEHYTIFEFPGQSLSGQGASQHSGLYIKTSHLNKPPSPDLN